MKTTTLKMTLLILALSGYLAAAASAGDRSGKERTAPIAEPADERFSESSGAGNGLQVVGRDTGAN